VLGPPPQPIGTSRGADQPHRLFDGTNSLAFFLSPPPKEVELAFERLERTLGAYAATARAAGVRFLVLFFPQRYQVQPEDWGATVESYGLNAARFDLAAPGRRLGTFCRANGIAWLDLAPALAAAHERSGRSLYLPGGDMHWNPDGHRAVAAAVKPAVLEQLPR
jgi:lysophospholipase L1-like esterase